MAGSRRGSEVTARGRRPKPSGSRRTSAVRVRLTEAEQRAFAEQARALRELPSRVHRRLVREFTVGEPDYFGGELVTLRVACDELSRVGNNLNQLVRLAHQGQWPADAGLERDLEAMLGVVRSMHASLSSSVRRVRERWV
jgi:hypothetical protein